MRKPELLLHTVHPHADAKTRSSLLTSLSARLQPAAVCAAAHGPHTRCGLFPGRRRDSQE